MLAESRTHSWFAQVHAKDLALIDKEREHLLDQIHARDDMLKTAHSLHVEEMEKLRRDIVGISEQLAHGRTDLANEKHKRRQMESRNNKLQERIDEVKQQADAAENASSKQLNELNEKLAASENENSNLSKKEKQTQLQVQKLQHDTLLVDTVLTERIGRDDLRKIREEIMERMNQTYADVQEVKGEDVMLVPESQSPTLGGEATQCRFGYVQRMYNDVLEQKVLQEEQVHELTRQGELHAHELKQAAVREAAANNSIRNLERQLERKTVEVENEQTAYLALREELNHTKGRMGSKLRSERETLMVQMNELQGLLAKTEEDSRAKVEKLSNEVHVKEMKLAALQQELDLLTKATKDVQQDSAFSSAVKKVIAKQRGSKQKAMEHIIQMHNSRTPNTPRLDSETSSVEDMYRDLLEENNGLKSSISQLQQDLKSMERANVIGSSIGWDTVAPSAEPSSLYGSLSAQKYEELRQSRRDTLEEFDRLSGGSVAAECAGEYARTKAEIDDYRQSLLNRARDSLTRSAQNRVAGMQDMGFGLRGSVQRQLQEVPK